MALDSCKIEMCLADSYYERVLADSPLGFWPLNELRDTTGARDRSGNLHDGSINGSPELGALGPFPHGGTAIRFDKTNDYVTMGDIAAFEFTAAFSVEFMFKFTAATDGANHEFIVSKMLSTTKGWGVFRHATGNVINFAAFTSASATVFSASASSSFVDSLWHHCVCTWDGTTGANGVKIYVDGAVVGQATAVAGTIDANAAFFSMGARSGSVTEWLRGSLAGVAIYTGALSSTRIAAHYAATVWTNVSSDVDGDLGVEWDYGISGNAPMDRLATSGMLSFTLQNYAEPSSGRVQGYYSPNHASCRSGFTHGIPVRVVLNKTTDRYKFWGRLIQIDPAPGRYRSQLTACIAHDYPYVLAQSDVRELGVEVDQSEDDLMRAVIEALPVTSQPMAVDFNAGLDVYPLAFGDVQGGQKAPTPLFKVIISSWGKLFVDGAGTLTYRNRQALYTAVSALTLGDSDLRGLIVPSTRDNVFNHIRVTAHPMTEGGSATEVLYTLPNPMLFTAGEEKTIWGAYTDPNNRYKNIGGKDFQDPPVSATDFIAFANEDGSGANRTADFEVKSYFFVSVVKLIVVNTGATDSWLTTLQVRGRGIYDQGPFAQEKIGDSDDRPLSVDLSYQDDPNVAQALAEFILGEYEDLADQVDEVTINPQESAALLVAALDLEPGRVMLVSETVTGLADVAVVIHRVKQRIKKAKYLECTWETAPALAGAAWLLGEAGRGELGETTILGAG